MALLRRGPAAFADDEIDTVELPLGAIRGTIP